MAIDIMLKINQTSNLDRKKETLELSVLTAMKAFKQSNLLQNPKGELPPTKLDNILDHVVGECYLRDENFSLHLNLTFMLMIYTKNSGSEAQKFSCLKSVARFLAEIEKSITSEDKD